MNFIFLDIAILVVFIIFALWGMRRGFVMTLCSLIALLVALVGAVLVTNLFAPTVADWIQPAIEPSVTSAVENALPAQWANLSTSELGQLLEQADLPFGLENSVQQLLEQSPSLDAQALVEDLSVSLSQQAAEYMASALVFLVCFILILLLWRMIARGLDLVARLPGLHFLNKLGGLVLGAFRGAVFVYAGLWLLRMIGLLSQQAEEESALVGFFLSFNLL
ncbi:MAG: CvpA family protein [Oscillospiraceae bacterium]|nr:CvpA family protein [Oscillospiraceae bacterium]